MSRPGPAVLVSLAAGIGLAACSPAEVGELAIHRLADGTYHGVVVACERGLTEVSAHVGELDDSTPEAGRWQLQSDPVSAPDRSLEWPLVAGPGSPGVTVHRPLGELPSSKDLTLITNTPDHGGGAGITLTAQELRTLEPGAFAFVGLDGEVRFGSRAELMAHSCP